MGKAGDIRTVKEYDNEICKHDLLMFCKTCCRQHDMRRDSEFSSSLKCVCYKLVEWWIYSYRLMDQLKSLVKPCADRCLSNTINNQPFELFESLCFDCVVMFISSDLVVAIIQLIWFKTDINLPHCRRWDESNKSAVIELNICEPSSDWSLHQIIEATLGEQTLQINADQSS